MQTKFHPPQASSHCRERHAQAPWRRISRFVVSVRTCSHHDRSQRPDRTHLPLYASVLGAARGCGWMVTSRVRHALSFRRLGWHLAGRGLCRSDSHLPSLPRISKRTFVIFLRGIDSDSRLMPQDEFCYTYIKRHLTADRTIRLTSIRERTVLS